MTSACGGRTYTLHVCKPKLVQAKKLPKLRPPHTRPFWALQVPFTIRIPSVQQDSKFNWVQSTALWIGRWICVQVGVGLSGMHAFKPLGRRSLGSDPISGSLRLSTVLDNLLP